MTREVTGQFVKRGGGYFLLIDEEFTEDSPFKKGDELHFIIEDGRLIIRKARPGEEPSGRML